MARFSWVKWGWSASNIMGVKYRRAPGKVRRKAERYLSRHFLEVAPNCCARLLIPKEVKTAGTSGCAGRALRVGVMCSNLAPEKLRVVKLSGLSGSILDPLESMMSTGLQGGRAGITQGRLKEENPWCTEVLEVEGEGEGPISGEGDGLAIKGGAGGARVAFKSGEGDGLAILGGAGGALVEG